MNNPKFQLYLGSDKQFRFRLHAANGEIILSGEGYASKAGCQNAIRAVKENAPNDQRYERKVPTNSQFYFVLLSSNGETIGIGETYTTQQHRDEGIAAVKNTAPSAPVEDTA